MSNRHFIIKYQARRTAYYHLNDAKRFERKSVCSTLEVYAWGLATLLVNMKMLRFSETTVIKANIARYRHPKHCN
jgi:hypothetical protein